MYLLNVKISETSRVELIEKLLVFLEDGNKHHIVTTNPEFIVEAQENLEFRNTINNADVSLIDGIGVLAGILYSQRTNYSRNYYVLLLNFLLDYFSVASGRREVYLDNKRLERITGVDLVYMLVQQDWIKGRKVYLLGGKNNVSSQAARKLKLINPDIQFRFSNGVTNVKVSDAKEEESVIADINNFKPDVLLVAYGHPWQDLWISRNKEKLNFRVAVGVGGTFDYIAGVVLRAPYFIRKFGLEWLFRLIRQPKRFNRIKNATLVFARMIVMSLKNAS